jgi:hypothetical protein
MSITARQFQNLQLEACRLAAQLPRRELLDGLVAAYEAGRLLRLTRGSLVGLLGSVVLRCIDDQTGDDAPPAPPAPGLWPRLVRAVTYDPSGALHIAGVDDHDRPWQETFTGSGQEAWLLKQLYVERRYGRRPHPARRRRPRCRP